MQSTNFKYIYGPVSSWRLGRSLGIDLLSQKDKICSFNCIYCQLGKTKYYTTKRKVYVSTEDIIKEVCLLPDINVDYFTLSGRGEPTIAENMGEVIKEIKKIRKEPVAVLTNASLVDRIDVVEELVYADFVSLKLDACSEDTFNRINKPAPEINFSSVLNGIKKFREIYKGKLALQIMFVNENKDEALKIAELAQTIQLDEVQINTPTRPCGVKPLSPEVISQIRNYFKNENVVSVYEKKRERDKPINMEDTIRRRGKIV